jgi:hypothetical protein
VSRPALKLVGPGEWELTPESGAVEFTLSCDYELDVPAGEPGRGGRRVAPVGLLLPVGAARVGAEVRVWPQTGVGVGQTVVNASPAWRELPIEPVPGRDTLPVLVLAASGAEPLELEARPAESGSVTVWVERGLVEAWGPDDGVTTYRARFLVGEWLTPAVEVRLPGPLADPNPEFFRDGYRVDPTPVPVEGGEERRYRIPLPAATAAGTVVEVRYQLPTARGRTGESVYLPPTLPGVAYRGEVQWLVSVPEGSLPFLTAGATAEFLWRPSPVGVGPVPAASPQALDAWFRTGQGPATGEGEGGDRLTARQAVPGPLAVYRAPRAGVLTVCSVVAFLIVLLLSRLPSWAVGPGVALVGLAGGVAAVFYPHPAAQAVGACQPGLVAAAAVLLLLAGARWSYRRRVTHLPGFTRTDAEPDSLPTAQPLPSSNRNRPPAAGTGSAARAPMAATGG